MSKLRFYRFLLMMLINHNLVQCEVFQSLLTLGESGMDFFPANPIEFIGLYTNLLTLMSCYHQCNLNPRCRTFVSDTTQPFDCRLYEGLVNTGTITVSPSSNTSRVAALHYDASFYTAYNRTCDPNLPAIDRYLVCINKLWQCPTGTYWNGAMCLNQVYYETTCNTNNTCRQDIGLQCLSCGKCLCNGTNYWNGSYCVSSTDPTLLPADRTLTALWPLDGDAQDLMNIYNGTLIGNLSFVTGYIGQAIECSNRSYVLLPHIDFYRRSFTVELWFYITDPNQPTMNLFGECPGQITAQCLHYNIVPNSTLRMGFFWDDVDGSTTLVVNQWYHVAFVYDYDRRQQLIYLNGLLEKLTINEPYNPHLFLGQTGNATIGAMLVYENYFYGYIDHVSISYRAKTAPEILDDATLIAYYSFDNGSTYDSGINLLHGTMNEGTVVTGRMNNALQFNSSNAYFQASGFTALGMENQSFSISLWIKPSNLVGTIVHFSSQATGDGWCDSVLGFDASGQLIAKVRNLIVNGPTLTLNVWTHIVQVFNANSDIYLFVNQVPYVASGQVDTTDAPNQPIYITLANRLSADSSCVSAPITNGTFVGSIDELRIYNRQLDSSDICALYKL